MGKKVETLQNKGKLIFFFQKTAQLFACLKNFV